MRSLLKPLALLCLSLIASAVSAQQQASVEPQAPPSLSIVVKPGQWQASDGKSLILPEAVLSIRPPEIRKFEAQVDIPANYLPRMDSYDLWPSDRGKPGILNLVTRSEHSNTLILGGLYRQLLPETLVLTDLSGTKTFNKDTDYRVHPLWSQVANIDNRLGIPGSGKLNASFSIALQRLDLLQFSSEKLSIKKGRSVLVCPTLPEPDKGATAVAGIYVAPWKLDKSYAVDTANIFPIRAAPPISPVNRDGVARTRARLEAGEKVTVAFMGDSVTLGAEATAWTQHLWTERNRTYPSQVVVSLRQQYPTAEIEPVHAVKGGTSAKVAAQFFDEVIAPAKPDLLLIAFGLNDANSAIGKPASNPVESYREGIRDVIRRARTLGTEVMLVTPMQPSPFLKSDIAARIPAYQEALLLLSREEKVACADVYSAWMQQAAKGTPPYTQLHNWINHPGNEGHTVYAETILRFFAKP